MIRNLNQLNFQGFGIIFPERPVSFEDASSAPDRTVLSLTPGDAPVYRTESDTQLVNSGGMTVLSVSRDGSEFLHFYLDKPVCVHAGVYFCLTPFQQERSSAAISAPVPPEPTGVFQRFSNFHLQRKLRVTDLYTFFYQEKERGFFFPGESHPMLELTYVDQGSIHSVADGKETILQQGELVIYGPNQWHMQYADIDVAPRYVTISFDMESECTEQLINRKFTVSQQSATILHQLLREQDRMDEFSADMIVSQLSILLLTLLRDTDLPSAKLKSSNFAHSENEIIQRAQQYISTHIREKISVPHLAKMVDVSPSYLTALFHKNLQISPGEYIRRIKLQESKQMIRENSLTFTEIAAALQYSTVHHFSRQFKEKFGITPTEYARSVR